MTVGQLLRQGCDILTSSGVPDAAYDAGELLSLQTGVPRLELLCGKEREVSLADTEEYLSRIARRAKREPLQYITEEQSFYGLSFDVTPEALIPRQDTEWVCEKALELIRDIPAPCVLDLCTGSGVLAAAISHMRPDAVVCASDVSIKALDLAKRNAEKLGVKAEFRLGDLFEPWKGERFHLIVSNPPYIPESSLSRLQSEVRWEPRLALNGGKDGLDFYRRIAAESPKYLLPSGILCLETGDGQQDSVRSLMEQDFMKIGISNDLNGLPRVCWGYLKENAC